MKTENLWRVWLMSLAAAVVLCVTACGGDDWFEPDPTPTPLTPVDTRGELVFSFGNPGSGTGTGTAADPAVAQCGDTLSVAITAKSTYTDPDGTVYTCEPEASITAFTGSDTLYVEDLKTLLDVKEEGIEQKVLSPRADMKTLQQLQKFSVGGKKPIIFGLAHDVYTYVNSQEAKIEMPYVRINPAQYGGANTNEEGDIPTSVRKIRLKRVAPSGGGPRRAASITDSTTYDVTMSFTLGLDGVNTKKNTSQVLSVDVAFVAVVAKTTEVPDPKKSFEYELTKSGTNSAASPYTVILGEPLSLNWQQKASYQYFSMTERTDMETKYEPKAYVEVNASKADTIWVSDVAQLEKIQISPPTITNNGTNPVENTGLQTFEIAEGPKVSIKWGYQSYKPISIEGTEVELPYLSLSKPTADVKVVEVANGVLKGKKGKLYTVTLTIDQDLATVNVDEPKGEHLQYVAKYLAGVAVEEPKLVDIKYRTDYQPYEPHDNIPWTYQYLVYRDSIFSGGSVRTSVTRSAKTTMDWYLDNTSYHGDYTQKKEDVRGVTVYYHQKRTDLLDEAYRNVVISRKIGVPDVSLVTVKTYEPEITSPDQWERYTGYDPSNPQAGWYFKGFDYCNPARIYYKGELLANFNITSVWYNHILYVEDGINGGQLIDFLEYQPKFDFTINVVDTTMPTGEPAKVFTHKCITTMFGSKPYQFHYEIVDSVYQSDPEHPPF